MRITKAFFNAQEQKKKDLDRLAKAGRLRPLKKRETQEAKELRLKREKAEKRSAEKKENLGEEEQGRQKKLARLLRRLRGTPKIKKARQERNDIEYVDVSFDEETGEYVRRDEPRAEKPYEENVREYIAGDYDVRREDAWETSENAAQGDTAAQPQGFHFIYQKNPDLPEGMLSTALSVAVGIIYYDETGGLVDRLITVRRIFGRKGDILIDAFCHDIEAPRMIFLSKAVRLYDIKTLLPYAYPAQFLLQDIGGYAPDESFRDNGFIAAMTLVRYDLAALAYLAKADADKSDLENKLIFEYVKKRCRTVSFDEEQMMRYISRLFPDEQSFYEAVEVIVKYPHEDLQLFVETFLQLVLSDSVIHDNERELLAELLYLSRLQGAELNILGLR